MLTDATPSDPGARRSLMRERMSAPDFRRLRAQLLSGDALSGSDRHLVLEATSVPTRVALAFDMATRISTGLRLGADPARALPGAIFHRDPQGIWTFTTTQDQARTAASLVTVRAAWLLASTESDAQAQAATWLAWWDAAGDQGQLDVLVRLTALASEPGR